MLDILAGRKRKSGLSGIVLVNGDRQPKNFKCISGYVVQVRETLMSVWVGVVCVGGSSVCGWEQCVWVGAVCVGGGRCRGSPLVTAHGGGRYIDKELGYLW